MVFPSCTPRESSASFAASGVKTQAKASPCQVMGTIVSPPEGRRNFLENAVKRKPDSGRILATTHSDE
jgi:hypothetical protein